MPEHLTPRRELELRRQLSEGVSHREELNIRRELSPTVGYIARLKEIGTQFVAGLDDITQLIELPFQKTKGTFQISSEGIEFFSPEETVRAKAEGRLGLPGRATTEPTSLFGKGMRLAGQSAAAGPILGKFAAFVPKPVPALTKLGRFKQLPQKLVAGTGEAFVRAPIATTAIETGLGFTAGATGFIAQQMFPDSDTAVFIGEIVGGTAPALMPIRLATHAAGGTRKLFRKVRRPFTPEGGRERAIARVQRAATPEQRVEALQELEAPTTIDPATGEPVLTIAERTGEPGLLALEQSVMESSEESTRLGDVNIAHANEVIQTSLDEIAEGALEAPGVSVRESQEYFAGLFDVRVRIAAQRIDERLAELGPKASREQLNRIASEEIDGVLAAATKHQKQLYDAIPENTAVPYSNAKAKYDLFIRQLGKPQQGDIPDIAKRFLNDNSDEFFGSNIPPGFLKDETRIKDLRGLQSKLREVARNARSGDKKNLNKARIADEIANSITDDLANTRAGEEVSKQLSIAVEFSRDLNHRFSSGAMAKILGRKATGAERVPAGLTLEESIGVTGPKARESLDELYKAFDSPEAPSSALLIDASEDFVRTNFLKDAVQRGEFNVRAAQRFLLKNEEILNRLPNVRRQIEEAIEAGDSLALIRQKQKVSLDDARVSKATMLIEKGPVETFRNISKLQPSNQITETRNLVNKMAGDETGEALKGLKSGFIEFLYTTARKGKRDVQGRSFMSGFALKEQIEKSKSAMEELFSPEELKRIEILNNDLIKLEKRIASKAAPEGIIGDKAGKVARIISQVSGARFGGMITGKIGRSGIQIPQIFSAEFRRMTEAGVRDPAGRLLRDAIIDEELFKEFLQSAVQKDGTELTEKATRRLNIWVATVLAEYGGVFEEPGNNQDTDLVPSISR